MLKIFGSNYCCFIKDTLWYFMIRIRSRVIILDSVDIMQLFGLMDNWTQNQFLSSWTLACLQLDLAGWWLSDFWSSCSSGFRHSHAPWTGHDSWNQSKISQFEKQIFFKEDSLFGGSNGSCKFSNPILSWLWRHQTGHEVVLVLHVDHHQLVVLGAAAKTDHVREVLSSHHFVLLVIKFVNLLLTQN